MAKSIIFANHIMHEPMLRTVFTIIMILYTVAHVHARERRAVVADSATGRPLSDAVVFDLHGKYIGSCGADGTLPFIYSDEYPVTVRLMGYEERNIPVATADTVFMKEQILELPEFVVESREHRVLHMLAYVREYSTLSTYSDTIFMFREKMVDYMLPSDNKVRFKGWTSPRVLTSKSYYRFTNSLGLDSVSDRCNQHFSWADWVGIPSTALVPAALTSVAEGTDSVQGRYGAKEVWMKHDDRITLDVNVINDATSRRWVPNLSLFFREGIDFEQFRLRFRFDNVFSGVIAPIDLSAYSFNIESNGRGRGMFMFNRVDEPFFVSTYAEVYVVDKEFITVKEAKQWDSKKLASGDIAIYEPAEAPDLQEPIRLLVQRVNSVDHSAIRLAQVPDERLAGCRNLVKLNAGQQILQRLKGLFGIDHIRGRQKWNNNWKEFRKERVKKNKRSATHAD